MTQILENNPVEYTNLIQAGESTDGPINFYLFDTRSFRMQMVDLPQLTGLSSAGFCRISSDSYFICGRDTGSGQSELSQSYILQIPSNQLIRLQALPFSFVTYEVLYYKSNAYLLGVTAKGDLSVFRFCIADREWARIADSSELVSSIERIFSVDDKLVMVFNSMAYMELDLETSKFSRPVNFSCKFRKFYVTSSGCAILIGASNETLYEYDFTSDQIRLIVNTPEIKKFDISFYSSETDSIIFLESATSNLAIFTPGNNMLKHLASSEKVQFLSKLKFIRGADNRCLKLQNYCDSFNTSFVHSKDESPFTGNGLILGSGPYPFKMIIGFDEGEYGEVENEFAKVTSAPQTIRCCKNQSILSIDEDRFLFIGGEKSSPPMTAFTYNITTSEIVDLSHMNSGNFSAGSTVRAFNSGALKLDKKSPPRKRVWYFWNFMKMLNSYKESEQLQVPNDLVMMSKNNEISFWDETIRSWISLRATCKLESSNFLDDPEKLLLYCFKLENDQHHLILQWLNPQTKVIEEAFNQAVAFHCEVLLSLKTGDARYLLICRNDSSQCEFIELTLFWGASSIEKASFAKLDASDQVMGLLTNAVKHLVINNMLLVFFFDVDERMRLVFFNLANRCISKSASLERLGHKIVQEFQDMGLNPSSALLADFAFTSQQSKSHPKMADSS